MKKATSSQGSFSHNSEANLINKLDSCKPLPLNAAQVFKSRYSVTQARKPWFFCALEPVLSIGRGGIGTIQKRFTVKTYAPFCSGFEHPDCLQKQSLQKTTGAHILMPNTPQNPQNSQLSKLNVTLCQKLDRVAIHLPQSSIYLTRDEAEELARMITSLEKAETDTKQPVKVGKL